MITLDLGHILLMSVCIQNGNHIDAMGELFKIYIREKEDDQIYKMYKTKMRRCKERGRPSGQSMGRGINAMDWWTRRS